MREQKVHADWLFRFNYEEACVSSNKISLTYMAVTNGYLVFFCCGKKDTALSVRVMLMYRERRYYNTTTVLLEFVIFFK